MKIECEVSKPHYHPGKSFKKRLTKKRDLSVPPNWVANERIEKDGISYAIVMPKRDKELYEIFQEPHIHLPKYITVNLKGKDTRIRLKVEDRDDFEPKAHFDESTAILFNIDRGETIEI